MTKTKKMVHMVVLLILIFTGMSFSLFSEEAAAKSKSETFQTDKGPLVITFVGHGSLMFSFDKMIIHIDPFSRVADYSTLPKADLIVITHHHGDHLDPAALEKIKTEKTDIIYSAKCAEKIPGGTIMRNNESKTVRGIKIEAVPAYNIIHKRDDGNPYHIKEEGNGYIFHFGNKRVYVAGDTENIPEMEQVKSPDIAILPMNLPYTMTPQLVADAVKMIKPKILYVYHFFPEQADFPTLINLIKEIKGVELRLHD